MVLSLLLTTAGVSAATFRYDRRNSNRLLQGVSIGGVDVGGLNFSSAQSLLNLEFEGDLNRRLTVEAKGEVFTVSPRELGMTIDWREKFVQAQSFPGSMPLVDRVWHRLTGTPMNLKLGVSKRIDRQKLDAYVTSISTSVNSAPKDATLRLNGTALEMTPEVNGYAIDHEASAETLRAALANGESRFELKGQVVPAKVQQSSFSTVLLVKVGENKLYHYKNGQVVKVYDVASGKPNYPTPKGQFRIVRKRISPTWYNPAKNSWGRNMPSKIPPGPRNPLGSRVLDMNGTLARIHATFRGYSIGYNDSQGCIRMRTADIEELFPQVEVGTPVLIVQSGINRLVPSQYQTSTQEPSAENDAGGPAAAPPTEQPAPPPEQPPQPLPVG